MTPQEAYNKAIDAGQRLPKLEPIIKQSTGWACNYARDVIIGRWPEAEPVIQQDAQWACWYAKCVIKDRWPEAEDVIAQSEYDYTSLFFSEPVITKDQCAYFEWEKAGAVGFFAPRRLFEIERKESLIDMMIGNDVCRQDVN